MKQAHQRKRSTIGFHLYDYMWNLKNKTNKQHRNRGVDAENWRLSEGGVGELGEKGEGLGSKNGSLRNDHRDVDHSVGGAVSDTVTATHGAGGRCWKNRGTAL